jgi:molybdenum cofactor cytidylyltransferase
MKSVDCVITAAGLSSRMGSWKMMLLLDGSPVIEHSVRNALKACCRVVLVSGYRGDELAKFFSGWDRVETVYNPDYEKGMFASIKRGIERVKSEKCFISLGDMPRLDPDVYSKLLSYPGQDCVIPKYRGKLGHPILIGERVKKGIAGFPEPASLKDVLQDFPTLSVPVDDAGILIDLDSKEDYERYRL